MDSLIAHLDHHDRVMAWSTACLAGIRSQPTVPEHRNGLRSARKPTSAVFDFVAVLTGFASALDSAKREAMAAASPSNNEAQPSPARYLPSSISSVISVPSGLLKYGKGAGGLAGAASYISNRTVKPSLKQRSTTFTIVTSELLVH